MRRSIVLSGLLFGAAVSGCRQISRHVYRPPSVALRSVRLDGIGLTGGALRVGLVVRNPNFYPLSTAGMRYRLLVRDSITIANGVDTTHRRVASNDSATVELPVDVSWSGLSVAGRDIAENGLVSYRLVGDIALDTPLGTHDIPVNQTGHFAPLR